MLTAALEAFDDQSPLGRLLAERRASRSVSAEAKLHLSVGSDGIVSAPISVVESASELRQLAEKQDTGKRAGFWRGTIVNATEAQRQQIMAALCNPSISARFAMRMRGSLLECLFQMKSTVGGTADACREQICAAAEWKPSQKMWLQRAIDGGSYDVAINDTIYLRSAASDEAEATRRRRRCISRCLSSSRGRAAIGQQSGGQILRAHVA